MSSDVERDDAPPCGSGQGTGVSRRGFFKATAAGAAAAYLTACGEGRLREASRDELLDRLARFEAEYRDRYERDAEFRADYEKRTGKVWEIEVGAEGALPGVAFAYALDISRCVGCRRCVYACVEENNPSRDPQIHWIRVLEMGKAKGIDFSHAEAYYDPPAVPQEGHFYLPISCQQCDNPPCVKVCPVGATYKEPDGIVVVDYDWCIGCRYCMAACPYGARHFNWSEPVLPIAEVQTETHALGNRPRPKGVVEKCTFCIQRTRKGLYPACVEICPVGARKFGNLLDPASEVRQVIEHKRVLVLKDELNTMPRFFYFYGV